MCFEDPYSGSPMRQLFVPEPTPLLAAHPAIQHIKRCPRHRLPTCCLQAQRELYGPAAAQRVSAAAAQLRTALSPAVAAAASASPRSLPSSDDAAVTINGFRQHIMELEAALGTTHPQVRAPGRQAGRGPRNPICICISFLFRI